MLTKVSSVIENDNDGVSLLNTQTTIQNKNQQSSCCSSNSQKKSSKPIQQQKKKRKSAAADGCCDTGLKKYCCYINVTPLFNAYVVIARFVMDQTKYFYYLIISILYPCIFYRFFIRNGYTPFNDFSVLLKMLQVAFFSIMAYWSHYEASPPTDPGCLEKRHFRKTEQIQNQECLNGSDQNLNGEKDESKPQQYPFECAKCGTLKVLGVHHCSKCNRCVYKMDHHCPWTNNCVGYMTMKPFILFLFYVTCISFFSVGYMYKQAWTLKMQHISLVQTFVPAGSNVKHMMTMYYLNETERDEVVHLNDLEYQRQVAFEKEHPEIFSWAVLKDLMFSWEFTRFYFMYSWETFWDFVTIVGTLACGIYTFILLVQTISFARQQTSMVDDMKIKKYLKNRKLHRKELIEYWQVDKRRRTLSWTELWELVFGEPTLFSMYTYIPKYMKPRSMDIASYEYLNSIEMEEDKKEV